ncbi:nuclear single stranded DNA specific 5'-3' exodeoxyribonuclease Exo5.1 [Schizosaccharomyces pombe]|uniref:Exonuclease V n=2 Tax=Schizosaccharomyces pombe (strain 972 / ATCC 24843) TaxID=284812 RepID=EXO5_SCHPO|nr:putative single-strand DNA-specific 5'-3' exodeoxyribonuclease Exo5 [Schizosaccharomyces pombe]Q9Y7L4.1 RecName: Full=Probable exonuclease V, mitochondrial; Short=Exo V [Schizosaccharomyces pombe 972h-]CAB39359.1 mitochondrial single stranded DNA specific 5'-3' exodeoxyribonuclease Exo5 (predicted) [Schizosaccharomyces pombe]|eukprot:NP_596136.1 putative single-strand DNA-specific 5'-3' exodeoxyribonuclease Exo5 [Schizosaccharomyces pombe]
MEEYEDFEMEDLSELVSYMDYLETQRLTISQLDYSLSIPPQLLVSREISKLEDEVCEMLKESSLFQLFRKHKGYLNVTDLVLPLWCEVQHEYYLLRRIKKKTPKMERGIKLHQILEYETSPPSERRVLDRTSKEEPWALRLLRQLEGIMLLQKNGITREFPIWGYYKESSIFGIIDEISLNNPSKSNFNSDIRNYFNFKMYDLSFVDNKTRFSSRKPGASQILSSKVQLMYYVHLFLNYFPSLGEKQQSIFRDISPTYSNRLHSQSHWWNMFLSQLSLDGTKDLGPKFLEQSILSIPDIPEDVFAGHNSLNGLYALVFASAKKLHLRLTDDNLTIAYRNDKTGEVVYKDKFSFSNKLLEASYTKAYQFWHNLREPEGVPAEEVYKCRSCEFQKECWWLKKKQYYPLSSP